MSIGRPFYFSTGKQSRKARNLAANPQCVIATEVVSEAEIKDAVKMKRKTLFL